MGSGRRGQRLLALDGLRGVAAVVVLVHHALLTSPSLAAVYAHPGMELAGVPWLLTYTPLHLLWGGEEAVTVFFVLSGFVLAQPFLGGATAVRWARYYPQRLVRLYLPVWGAVTLAVILSLVVARTVVPGASYWLNMHAADLTPWYVGRNLLLVLGNSTLITPLWSLQWEVLFSLALPAFIFGGQIWRRSWPVKLAAVFSSLVLSGVLGASWLLYPAVLGLGVLLAVHREGAIRLANRVTRGRWAVGVVALLLLDANWWGPWVAQHGVTVGLADAASAVGACMVVMMFLAWSGVREFGETRVTQWLGGRSFSLYLIHEPIVVTLGFALGGTANVVLVLALSLLTVLPATEAFFRMVEHPSHLLSQKVGRAVAHRLSGEKLVRSR